MLFDVSRGDDAFSCDCELDFPSADEVCWKYHNYRLRCRSNQNLICSKYNSIRSYIFRASMACYSNNRTLTKHLLELKMCFVLVLLAAASCVSFNNFPLENYYLFEVVISLTTQKNSELSLKVQTNSPLYSW